MNGFQVFAENIAEHATKSEVGRLLRHWEALETGKGRLPSYADFNLNIFPDCQENIIILTPAADDYYYVYFGPGVVRSAGFDLTGRRLSDLRHPLNVEFKACYDACMRTGRPAFATFEADYKFTAYTYERLVLPLRAAAAGPGLLLVYNAPQECRQDILDAILQASTNGIIAMTPVYGDGRDVVDGVVIATNRAVEQIIGIPAEQITGERLLQTFPGLVQNGVWPRYRTVFETGRPDQFELTFEVDGQEKIFQVGVAPFSGGVTITFADVGTLVRANQSLEQQRLEMQSANQALEDQTRQLITLAKELEASRSTLAAEARRREELEEELRRIANTDDLTGIANRRAFTESAQQEIARAERFGHDLAAIVFDIDRFKSCNDTYGHAVGDYVLRTVARRVSEGMRAGIDIFGRIGGEEFAILLPESDRDGAVEAAERLRRAIAELVLGVNGVQVRITASFGVAAWSGFGEGLQGVLHRADAALYSAKRLGRNRVEADMPMVGLHDEIVAIERAE